VAVSTPGPRRVHGSYTLPILHDGRLIGRVDAKTQRADRRLQIRHVHFEPWFSAGTTSPVGGDRPDQDAALTGLSDALGSLARFVGAADIRLGRVTPGRLRSPLARALREHGPATR